MFLDRRYTPLNALIENRANETMTFDEFEHLARLHVIGALDSGEREQFVLGREEFRDRAEAYIQKCRVLNNALAASLRPLPPNPETREKLLKMIASAPRRRR